MNSTSTRHRTAGFEEDALNRAEEAWESEETMAGQQLRGPRHEALTGPLYRLHSFWVFDADGLPVGLVDWIWAEEGSGHGEFLGVRLHWLRGRARAVPAKGVRIDMQASTVHVPYRKNQIERAPRFAIDRSLVAEQKGAIASHYARRRSTRPVPADARRLAA